MYENALNILKGYHPTYGLTKEAKQNAVDRAAGTAMPTGSVVHLDSVGAFALGGSGTQMPIFLTSGADDRDVSNDGYNPVTTIQHWVGILPSSSGRMTGLVATGGYELQTTAFESAALAGRSYAVNDALTSTPTGKISCVCADDGVPVFKTDWICGIASQHEQSAVGATAVVGPVGSNAHGVSVLTFWTCFFPGAA
jgi:hypothetical protein